MLANYVKMEFGTVVGQLLEYQYQVIPKERRTKGQAEALVSARGWLESVLADEFQPKAEAIELIHDGDATTCDAVQFRYRAAVEFGELGLLVSQTVFVMTISVIPRAAPPSWRGDAAQEVMLFARRFFRHPERVNLRSDKQRDGLVLGRQVIPGAVSGEALDWLDTLQWWSDGTTIGFALLKRTGAGQAAVTSRDLQANQVWFRMFERPRSR